MLPPLQVAVLSLILGVGELLGIFRTMGDEDVQREGEIR
jgi:hypothetical protein